MVGGHLSKMVVEYYVFTSLATLCFTHLFRALFLQKVNHQGSLKCLGKDIEARMGNKDNLPGSWVESGR